MQVRRYLCATILVAFAHSTRGEVINIPQSALLPLGDPGTASWVAGDAGLSGSTTMKIVAEVTGTAVANSFLLDTQDNGFPAPPTEGVTDDIVVFPPEATTGATATMDVPSNCRLALFHDVYDETGAFLSGPNGILNENPVPGTSDAYLSSNTSVNYTVVGRHQLVKYYLVNPAHSYEFTSQWGTVTQLGSGFRAFIFLDDDHTPNYDYDDMIVGIVAPPCVDNEECSDGDPCNGEEFCDAGECLEGEPIICDDGDYCNGSERCVNGSCEDGTPPSCDDGITCTEDSCDGEQCVYTANDANCPDDGVYCNGTESCDGLLGCVSSGSPCEEGAVCDEEADVCRACQDDLDCDDANPCTVGQACVEGTCLPGIPVDCAEAGNQCAVASCSPEGHQGNCDVLTSVENNMSCDDGLFCTVDDSCQEGVCSGTNRNCSENVDPCHVGICNEELAECEVFLAEDETPCNDGDPCTAADACLDGLCHGQDNFGIVRWTDLVSCLTGPGLDVATECACYDLNDDDRIDMLDVDGFIGLFDGQ